MSNGLGALCDEFYVSSRLLMKLEMSPDNESVLHFFDRVRKEHPSLRKLRRRDAHAIGIETDPDEPGVRRWLRLDPTSIRFGQEASGGTEEARRFGEFVLSQAPFHLTLSDLAYDHLDVAYGFNMHYRGNHDQLVAETLWSDHGPSAFLFGDHAAHVIDAQPYFGIALTPECDLQAYVEVKSRTATYEVRSGSFEGEPISVLLTVRKYFGLEGDVAPADCMKTLFETADALAADKIVPQFVNPLAAAIASRS
ncbi:MAG: hypothetical protein AABZ12_12640 [Planctomycetota bacterium]